MVKSLFFLPDQEINSCWSDLCPLWFSLAENAAVLNTFVRTIHQKKKKGDISVKECLLKRHKAILLWKVKWKAVAFIILLMRVTNVLTARRPLVIGGKFFLVRGLLVTSFQLEETLMKEFCGLEEPCCFHCCGVCHWRDLFLCVVESLPLRCYRVVSIAAS